MSDEIQAIDARYLDHQGEQLYVVLHGAENPVAQVLLAGPFPSERVYSYLPWVGWARYLAQRGFQALRFDYRGCGESTGDTEKQSLTGWIEDMRACIAFLRSQTPGLPLVLHGLGFGGLLAAKLFSEQTGDALLLWSPPKSGREAFRAALMRRLAIDYGLFKAGQRRSWKDYMAELEQTGVVDVEGYPCSRDLWKEGNQFPLITPAASEQPGTPSESRPWKLVALDKSAEPLVAGIGQWRAANLDGLYEDVRLNPDLSALYEENWQWIKQAVQPIRREEI
ncbi:MAG: alpha/beta fold hydrolase [Verrucomicrobiota bacterium]|jgi:pimeloyl-ACP methyl ester carboxylesterase